jgi:hypothetical protein
LGAGLGAGFTTGAGATTTGAGGAHTSVPLFARTQSPLPSSTLLPAPSDKNLPECASAPALINTVVNAIALKLIILLIMKKLRSLIFLFLIFLR